ncbi:hypothetical protein HZA96_01810 [Candidatus Woesearchaeota archaeon]|nr:hypothetical protein [Candidatus Woesearchaeota archaeon]
MAKSTQFYKKADLSINVIIITIIAIVVLIVITYIFTGRLAIFNKKISECQAVQGAFCIDEKTGDIISGSSLAVKSSITGNFGCDNNKGYIEDPSRVCFNDKKEVNPAGICCMPILN